MLTPWLHWNFSAVSCRSLRELHTCLLQDKEAKGFVWWRISVANTYPDTAMREGGATGEQFKGRDATKYQNEAMGEEQRPVQPNWIGEKWNEMKYGSPKGK